MPGFDDPFDDLDQLVSELNLLGPEGGRASVVDAGIIESWLGRVREADGSDLLLVPGAPPVVRAAGRLLRVTDDPLSGDDIESAVLPLVAPRLLERYRAGDAVDLAFKISGLGRFRMNLHRERGRAAAAIRALPTRIPRLADLHFSHDISLLSSLPRGLVLIGGPTGSGKTTTLASLIAAMNERDSRHIITVEDPIEYDHPHGRSIIEQVEIGIDTPDFPAALRAAVRQAPDVIVIGEMRDPESMRIAISAAETGHLVLATVHTTDVAAALSRIADGFPNERQNAIRQELAWRSRPCSRRRWCRRAPAAWCPPRSCSWSATARASTSGRTRCSTSIRRSPSPAGLDRSRSRNRWPAWSRPESSIEPRRSSAPRTSTSSSRCCISQRTSEATDAPEQRRNEGKTEILFPCESSFVSVSPLLRVMPFPPSAPFTGREKITCS